MARVYLLLSVCILCASIATSAYSNTPAPALRQQTTCKQDASSQTQRGGCSQKNESVPALVADQGIKSLDKQDPAQEKHDDADQKTPYDLWTFIATCFLSIGTIALAGASIWQVCETRTTAKRQLRAYISVIEFKITNVKKDSLPYPFIVIKNNGQTPARNVCITIDMLVAKYPWDSPSATENQRTIKNFYIGPGNERLFDVREGEPINQATFDAILNNEMAVWVHGSIIYNDIFGQSQSTTFRLFKNRTTGVGTEELSWDAEGNRQS